MILKNVNLDLFLFEVNYSKTTEKTNLMVRLLIFTFRFYSNKTKN